MYCVSHLASRNELGDYLNELGLTGKGVEIGTHQGDYAVQILSRWKGEKLYCVDPYERAPEYEDQVEKLPRHQWLIAPGEQVVTLADSYILDSPPGITPTVFEGGLFSLTAERWNTRELLRRAGR